MARLLYIDAFPPRSRRLIPSQMAKIFLTAFFFLFIPHRQL